MAADTVFFMLALISLHGTGKVATTTPPTCEYNGQTYQPDTEFQASACLDAYCDQNGKISYSSPTCCEYNNQTYRFGETFPAERCKKGSCYYDGTVELEDACCYYNGVYYEPGSHVNTGDPCEDCTCSDDKYNLNCAISCCGYCGDEYNLIPVPGQCCPRCELKPPAVRPCLYNGNYVQPGNRISTDSCNTVVCVGGEIEPDAPCCEYNGKMYKSGYRISTDSCNTAVCDDGEFEPDPQCCEYNGKMYKHQSTVQNGPCQTGICGEYDYGDIAWTFACCEYQGISYEQNYNFAIDPCTMGYCGGDYVEVDGMPCPSPVCENPENVANVCCPVCKDISPPVPDCVYNGQSYKAGAFYPEPCKACFCSVDVYDYLNPTATVTCGNVTCPTLTCSQPVQSPDKCCPVC